MFRDMDLIRKILINLEQEDQYPERSYGKIEIRKSFPDEEREKVNYHIDLLNQAGLIHQRYTPEYRVVYGLTWQGHDFLDLMKKDKVWEKAKDQMKKTGGMAFEVLVKVLIETATKAALGQM